MKNLVKNIHLTIKANEEKVFPYIWINGGEQQVRVHVRLVGEGASLQLVGVFLGTDNHAITFNTNVVHEAPYTKSLTHIRGVFRDRCVFSNDGMVHIGKGAKGADGYFASKILLFDDAKGRSVPALEIDENDLKAGHCATVGRPDENEVLYLRSRGISEDEAERLIALGFFEPILSLLSIDQQEQVREQLKWSLNE